MPRATDLDPPQTNRPWRTPASRHGLSVDRHTSLPTKHARRSAHATGLHPTGKQREPAECEVTRSVPAPFEPARGSTPVAIHRTHSLAETLGCFCFLARRCASDPLRVVAVTGGAAVENETIDLKNAGSRKRARDSERKTHSSARMLRLPRRPLSQPPGRRRRNTPGRELPSRPSPSIPESRLCMVQTHLRTLSARRCGSPTGAAGDDGRWPVSGRQAPACFFPLLMDEDADSPAAITAGNYASKDRTKTCEAVHSSTGATALQELPLLCGPESPLKSTQAAGPSNVVGIDLSEPIQESMATAFVRFDLSNDSSPAEAEGKGWMELFLLAGHRTGSSFCPVWSVMFLPIRKQFEICLIVVINKTRITSDPQATNSTPVSNPLLPPVE